MDEKIRKEIESMDLTDEQKQDLIKMDEGLSGLFKTILETPMADPKSRMTVLNTGRAEEVRRAGKDLLRSAKNCRPFVKDISHSDGLLRGICAGFIGKEIRISDPKTFARALEKADCSEIWTRVDGTVVMDVEYRGITDTRFFSENILDGKEEN